MSHYQKVCSYYLTSQSDSVYWTDVLCVYVHKRMKGGHIFKLLFSPVFIDLSRKKYKNRELGSDQFYPNILFSVASTDYSESFKNIALSRLLCSQRAPCKQEQTWFLSAEQCLVCEYTKWQKPFSTKVYYDWLVFYIIFIYCSVILLYYCILFYCLYGCKPPREPH